MSTTEDDLTRIEPAQCGTCGAAFDALVCLSPFDRAKVLTRQRHCDPCVEAEKQRIATADAARRAHKAEEDAARAWGAICPHDFKARLEGGPTDVSRLAADLPQFAQIIAHPLGPRGLILRGDTGAGKTRAMYRLLRVYFIGTPRPRIYAMTAGQFDRQARDAAGDFKLTEWFDRLARADVLFIDDVGKGKWTPATAGQFWELVDDRTRNGRPVFMTTNYNGEKLVKALNLDGDTAEPLLRRLREHCEVIVCKRGNA